MNCGNKGRPPKLEQTKDVYEGLAIAQYSATITCIGYRLKGGRGVRNFIVGKWEGVRRL